MEVLVLVVVLLQGRAKEGWPTIATRTSTQVLISTPLIPLAPLMGKRLVLLVLILIQVRLRLVLILVLILILILILILVPLIHRRIGKGLIQANPLSYSRGSAGVVYLYVRPIRLKMGETLY